MAKRDFSAYQKNVIRNYYENKDTILVERIQTAMSDLYLATSDKAREAHWKKIEQSLLQTPLHKADIEHAVGKRDLKALGELVKKLF